MKIDKAIAVIVAAMAFSAVAVQGQDVFRAKFKAKCQPADPSDKENKKMTDLDLIQQCVGTGFTDKELKNNFEVVYNPTADSIQVVNESDGSLICDVFQFQPGTNILAENQLTRFVFVFVPGQAESVGTAIITEKPVNTNGGEPKAKINGKIQFTTTEHFDGTTNTVSEINNSQNTDNSDTNNNSGDTNVVDISTNDSSGFVVQTSAIASPNSGVMICGGSFSAGKLFIAGQNNNNNNDNNNNNNDNNQTSEGQNVSTNDISGTNVLGGAVVVVTTTTNIVTAVNTNGGFVVTTNRVGGIGGLPTIPVP